eukprot:CAMPEP_0204857114 /NCGR_PEP_ID=MMETSP1347-20130617/20092_1 /ASSEMBLY_ACC=CAM_ASM_000690 /TAXON_ID=215587 /ORGANISM="Aplanochytrium stocchinoi, Strain GSBS06" /LENGTH=218 /DNA_ID=CAMNT_0052004305 /DNA_START=423 /DNA_END=1075 /DNA_ORIENTATION=-
MYPVVAYVFGSALSEIPYIVVSSTLLYVIFYFMVGLSDSTEAFLQGLVLYNLFILVNAYLGHVLASGLTTLPLCVLAATGFSSFWSLFSGFMISVEQIPNYFAWATYMCPSYFYIDGFISSQLFCSCEVDPIPLPIPTCDGGLNCNDVCDFDNSAGCTIISIPFTVPAVGNVTAPTVVNIPINVWQFVQGAFGFDYQPEKSMYRLAVFAITLKVIDFL